MLKLNITTEIYFFRNVWVRIRESNSVFRDYLPIDYDK